MPYYLGRSSDDDWILFQSAAKPTKATHGSRFTRAIGPFRTKVAASWFHRYGRDNPLVRTVSDAERLAHEDPRMELAIVEEGMTPQELADVRGLEWHERFVDELVETHVACVASNGMNASWTNWSRRTSRPGRFRSWRKQSSLQSNQFTDW